MRFESAAAIVRSSSRSSVGSASRNVSSLAAIVSRSSLWRMPGGRLDDLRHRPVGDALAVREAASPVDVAASCRACRTNSCSRRLLPMPGDPTMRGECRHDPRRAARSRARELVELRLPSDQRRCVLRDLRSRAVARRTTSQTSRAPLLPFACTGSASRKSNASPSPRTSRRRRGSRRWAQPTGCARRCSARHLRPTLRPRSRRAPSMTSASPVLMPIRMWRSSHSSSAFSSAIALRTASAARTRRSGSSSCAIGAAEEREDGVADELLEGAAVAARARPAHARGTGRRAT